MSIYRPKKLRYQDLSKLEQERALMFNYYNDLIRQYGKDVTYYRRDKGYLGSDSSMLYGHNADPKFTKYTDIRCYDTMDEYNFVLNGEGFIPSDKVTLYFGLTDFAASFAEDEGLFKSYPLIDRGDAVVSGTAVPRSGYLTIPFATEVYHGVCRIPVSNGSSGSHVEAEIVSGSEPILSVAFNPFIRRSFTTDYRKGHFSASIYVDYEPVRGGLFHYTLVGDVLYGSFFSNERVLTEIHPNPGDVIEIDYHTNDMVKEQYEITEEISRKPTNIDGISPFLGKYVFRCKAVRRIAAHEELAPEQSAADARNNFMDYSEARAVRLDSESFSSGGDLSETNVYGGYQKADAFQTDVSEVRASIGKIDEIFDFDQFRGDWADAHLVEGSYHICTFSDGTSLSTDGCNLFWLDSKGETIRQITSIDPEKVSLPEGKIPEMMYLRVLNGQVVFTTADLQTTVVLTDFPNPMKDGFDYIEGFSYKDVGYVSNDGYYIFKNSKVALNSFNGKYVAAIAEGNADPVILAKR